MELNDISMICILVFPPKVQVILKYLNSNHSPSNDLFLECFSSNLLVMKQQESAGRVLDRCYFKESEEFANKGKYRAGKSSLTRLGKQEVTEELTWRRYDGSDS